jgi:serine/threonine protein kinase
MGAWIMAKKKSPERQKPGKTFSSQDAPTVLSSEAGFGRFQSGYILNNRFVIKKLLGKGGMGIVYEAWDKELEQDIAVKVFRPDLMTDGLVSRLKREIKLARRIGHKNIARVYDINEHENIKFMTMELLKGETLHQRIYQDKHLPIDEFINLAVQITEAVGAAHDENIIHRDLKPGNIMITPEGTVKVLDFGLAFSSDEERLTKTDAVMGTMEYLSPEQAEGKTSTRASDIYSLGIIFFNMITGDIPFKGDSPLVTALKHIKEKAPAPSTFNKDMPLSLEKIILKCMQKHPEDRYQSCRELLAALKEIRPHSTTGERIRKNLRRKKKPVRALAALCIIIAAAIYFLFLRTSPVSSGDIKMEVALIGERMDLMGNVIEVILKENGTLYSNDGFQIHVGVDRDSFLYVVDMDQSGKVEVLFPRNEIKQPRKLQADKKYVLPAPNLWYRLDEVTGKETLYILASAEPNRRLDNLLSEFKKEGLDVKLKPAFDLTAEMRMIERGIKGIDTGRMTKFVLSSGKQIDKASEIIKGSGAAVKTVSFLHK